MRTPLACFVAVAVSCGGPSSTDTAPGPEPTTAETASATDTEASAATGTGAPAGGTPVLEIHEWGLLDVDLSTGQAELSAGPGQPARPVIARKPVIYAHLPGASAGASLDLRVRVPGGAILEHWPAGDLGSDAIGWHLDVSRGACAARGPVRDLPTPCASADGYCEVPELPRYVTDDHDCIVTGGESASLLFYRARIPLQAIPLRVERAPDLRVRASGMAGRTLLRISSALSGPWPPGHVVIARAQGSDAEIEIPVGEVALDPAAERGAMERALTAELGLTASEARVFLDAWSAALFGPDAAQRESVRRGLPASVPQDVLLAWMSADEIARVAPIETSAPVAARRAWLLRISLGAVATAGPARP